MAESIASPLVDMVIGKLGSEIWKELGLLCGVKKNIKKLQSTLSTIKGVLEDAEKKSISNEPLCNWLRKLKDAAYDADDVLDEFQTEALRRRMENRDRMKGQVSDFFSSHNQIAFRYRIAQKIKDVLEKFNEVAEERKQFHLIEGSVSITVRHEETHSFVIESEVYGRDDDKDKIVNLLLNEDNDKDLSVLAIVGLGGIGKTTLAQLAYNDEEIKSIFDVRGWVCVSDDFDARGIARKVIQCIDKEAKCDHLELDPLGQVLREKLGGKKFLLVMDDVWSEDQAKWDSLESLLRCGKKGSKIIATTRSDRVATVMHSALPYKLDVLSPNDCWNLFRERAFGAGREEEMPTLVEIGKKILDKCGGLPLAAKALGSLMSSKRGEVEWLAIQNSDIWRLQKDEDRILPSLRLSYHDLPSHLKNCYAYCSLFPKDYEFERMQLIRLWIAEGFVPSSNRIMHLEDIGNNYFNSLLWRSFFQDVKKNNDGDIVSFKMHDLMHDLACDVAKDEFCSIEIPEEIKLPDNCRYLSLIEPIVSSDVSDLPQQMKKLRSLIWLGEYRRGSLKLVNLDMSLLMHLRVLGLGKTGISMLPSTICKLRHLRFLDLSYTDIVTLPTTISNLYNLSILILSGCQRLEELPSTFSRLTNLHTLDLSVCYSLQKLPSSISRLHNLHTLNLSCCLVLKELPGDMSKMNNLRHLDIERCDRLTGMPPGMGQLSNLQTLSFFTVGEEDGCHMSELQHLNQLRGTLKIKNLHLVKNPREAKEANLAAKRHLKRLELIYEPRDGEIAIEMEEEVIENLEPPRDVEELRIDGYVGIRLPNWIMSSATVPLSSKFQSLTEIHLRNLSRCECLSPLGQLPSLKRLYIHKMDGVRRIGEEFYGQAEAGGSQLLFPFPSLEVLWFDRMCNLEEWVVEAGEIGRESMFPSLRSLYINNCPKLRVKQGLPVTVIHLTIRGCNEDMLSAGSLEGLSRLRDLNIRHCEASSSSSSSWEGLQYLNALETLHIIDCRKLTCLPEGMIHGHIPSLRSLEIFSNENLKSLGGDSQQQPPLLFTSLYHLKISACDALIALPEWLGCLTSLQSLSLWRCDNLEMLPDGLQRLTALHSLTISHCPLLERRCERGTGEDWHKITHIPNIEIYPTYTERSTGGVQLQEEEEETRRRRGFNCVGGTRGLLSCMRGDSGVFSFFFNQ